MDKKIEKALLDLEEKIKYFSLLDIGFIQKKSSPFNVSDRILHCQKCPLSLTRKNAVPGEGNINADLMFVGEAPGRDEDIQGRPFVGKAGQLLTKIINAMKFTREEVYITNVVKCRPPDNRTPNKDEINQCKEYLMEQIAMIKPKVIVSLGKVATDYFIPSKMGITSLRGQFYEFNQIKIMPTFHPSYLLRNEGDKTRKKMVWEDMKKVMAFLETK
ncbi:MAG: uracil-DNA glycosylase [Candidatus Aminicenantes bacterium]|nr:uracil-DNA glycosylase [Candidatus Aminicenantes bacterium]